ncbi:MAG: type I methionyl aminopeptidase [Candidatus Jettenia sp.]|nr:MAG: type I methionyl aminopeptidase [Candidatus Jettenia sp. AMX1]MBC6927705.1 type I methionyl aminopeptidase [Candidatus Jettenia sp.]GIL20369.1 MAG: type I methionyl aminopeptidase [Candidatus Jettenia caeni]MCE7879371.1 type I methionyl aminopeptidase [Candidatus Jettenia sp. AMX1]MDL1938320.1 type I methionyl aminopeptidase [Candidatus Jettenia sp. AMX1]
MIVRKSPREIELMRAAGRITADALRLVKEIAKQDVTTDYLNSELEKYIISQGGVPVFKGYRGFPKSICTSINEEVVHGVPDQRKLRNGDILSVDVGVGYRKYIADAAITMPIGEISLEAKKLLDVCEKSLSLAIEITRANEKLSLISRTIQEYVEKNGFFVVRNYTGHGIGRCMHEDPQVPNFVSKSLLETDEILMPGVTIAIEPMICMGKCDTEVLSNKWTVVTKDRKLSAHFEHTIVVTEDGADILTQ